MLLFARDARMRVDQGSEKQTYEGLIRVMVAMEQAVTVPDEAVNKLRTGIVHQYICDGRGFTFNLSQTTQSYKYRCRLSVSFGEQKIIRLPFPPTSSPLSTIIASKRGKLIYPYHRRISFISVKFDAI